MSISKFPQAADTSSDTVDKERTLMVSSEGRITMGTEDEGVLVVMMLQYHLMDGSRHPAVAVMVKPYFDAIEEALVREGIIPRLSGHVHPQLMERYKKFHRHAEEVPVSHNGELTLPQVMRAHLSVESYDKLYVVDRPGYALLSSKPLENNQILAVALREVNLDELVA